MGNTMTAQKEKTNGMFVETKYMLMAFMLIMGVPIGSQKVSDILTGTPDGAKNEVLIELASLRKDVEKLIGDNKTQIQFLWGQVQRNDRETKQEIMDLHTLTLTGLANLDGYIREVSASPDSVITN